MKKIYTPFLIVVFVATLSTRGWADTSQDEAMFGNTEPKKETPTSLADTLQIGGQLEIRANSGQEEQRDFSQANYNHTKQADIYFDAKPNSYLRSLLRLRLSETTPPNSVTFASATDSSCESCVKVEIDELWFKATAYESVFFTFGKQHVKWGSGTFWNPTDFTAVTTLDPFSLSDNRLGQELIKVHIPIEKYGFNYYALLQFNNMKNLSEIGPALRGEFAFGGIGEIALSFQTSKKQALRWGIDVSSGLGPVDVYTELAISHREKRPFFTGVIDPKSGTLPDELQREKNTFTQINAGLRYALKYGDSDQVTIGTEYFENGLGYEDRELELYALIKGEAAPLYAGKRYAGGYVQVPAPGSWNDTSFFVNAIHNLSDSTTMTKLTMTTKLYKELTLETSIGQCFGDYGELCFRVPSSIQSLASNTKIARDEQLMIAALPTRRTRTTLGLALNMNF